MRATGREWPAGSSISRKFAKSYALKTQTWTMLCPSGSDLGRSAYVGGPAGWGRASQPTSQAGSRNIAHIRALSAHARTTWQEIEVRANHV